MGVAQILELESIGDDVWRAWTPPGSNRTDIYGGQVAGQALRAASLSVEPGLLANSAHCYFLRRGQPELPLDIHVERVRAGRTYASRRIDVRQDGRSIFAMLASFHTEEPGGTYDHDMPPGVPGPEEVAAPDHPPGWGPEFELRSIDVEAPVVRWWGRIPGPLGDDPALHLCGLLYASDMRAGGAAIAALGYEDAGGPPRGDDGRPIGNFGSLDHAIWFHRLPRVDEWFFCEVRPLTVRDSRGLVLGTMFDQAGRHLATFTQEMFLKIF
jgi:acyl-CoA thioesterase-2